MKKFYKIMGIIAGLLFLAGAIMVGVAYGLGADTHFPLGKNIGFHIGNEEMIVQPYTELPEFHSIEADIDVAQIKVVTDDKYGVEYRLFGKDVICEVKEGVLYFTEQGYEEASISFSSRNHQEAFVVFHVPQDRMQELNIDVSLGSIMIKNVTADSMNIYNALGEIECIRTDVETVNIIAAMGSVDFDGTCTDTMTVDASMGEIDVTGFLDCDIDIDAAMGDVDVTTFYEAGAYQWDIDAGMGEEEINWEGGAKLEGKRQINIDCSAGEVELTFTDER